MLNKIYNMIRLLRPWQWYKNLVILIALIFTWGFVDFSNNIKMIFGFIALSFVASFNYVLNDIVDVKKDRVHPEKKKRPIASGEVGVLEALAVAVLLFFIGMFISYVLSGYFFITLIVFVLLTTLYSVWLKNIAILDVLLISGNFVLRGMSGAFILGVIISPWLIICTFLTALFLALGKRCGDLEVLGKKASKHKKVFKVYNKKMLLGLINMISGMLLFSYALYTLLTDKVFLALTVPFSVYFIFRYLYHFRKGDEIARKAHLFIKDINMLLTLIIWGTLVIIIEFYYVISI